MENSLIHVLWILILLAQSSLQGEENNGRLAKVDMLELQSSVIVYAMETGDDEMLAKALKGIPKDFIMTGANNRSWGDFSPLTFAVFNGKLDAVKLLIGQGFSVDHFDGYGCRPIDWILEMELENKAINELIYREEDGGEAKAIEAFVSRSLSYWSDDDIQCSVNGESPSANWQKAIEALADADGKEAGISIHWEQVDGSSFKYTFSFGGNLSGGGGQGALFSHQGYWVFKDEETWDN